MAKKIFRYEDELSLEKRRKNELNHLYDLFIKNEGQGYRDLRFNICEDLNENLSFEDIKTKIALMKTYYNVNKGEEMLLILKLSLAIEKNSESKIKAYKKELEDLNKKKFGLENTKKIKAGRYEILKESDNKNSKSYTNICDETIKKMKDVVKGKNEIREVNFSSKVTRYIEYIDDDLYMDFFIKKKELEPISKKEIDELLEVVNYFILNLQKNIEEFSSLSFYLEEDIEKIKNFKVSKEEELGEHTKDKIGNLYTWKLNRLNKILSFYMNYKTILEQIKEKELKEVDELSYDDKKYIKSDYEFLSDFYKRYRKLKSFDVAFVSGLANKNVTNKKRNSITKTFKNKLILD